MRLLSRYVLREFLAAFVISFLFFFIVFFVNIILVTVEDIVSKNVPFNDVLQLVLFSLPQIIALAFPFGSLLGSLIALGRLASDLEFLALQTCGIRLLSVFWPLFITGGVFSLLSFISNDLLIPASTTEFNRVYRKILHSNPVLELEPQSVKRFAETSIVTGDLLDGKINNVTIIDRTIKGEKRIITAKSAYLSESQFEKGFLSLNMTEVFSQTPDLSEIGEFEYFNADSMEYNIVLKEISTNLASLGPREKSSLELWRDIVKQQEEFENLRAVQNETTSLAAYSLLIQIAVTASEVNVLSLERRNEIIKEKREAINRQLINYEKEINRLVPDRTLRNYLFEFHKKFSVPISCLIFMIFSFPAGSLTARSGRAYGLLLGIIVVVIYWMLLFFGQTAGLRFKYSPALAMWFPNIIILLSSILIIAIRRIR